MKNFADLKLEVLSNEELMSVRGGDAPTEPIIIRGNYQPLSLSISTSTTTSKK
jgi:hypothetical protein